VSVRPQAIGRCNRVQISVHQTMDVAAQKLGANRCGDLDPVRGRDRSKGVPLAGTIGKMRHDFQVVGGVAPGAASATGLWNVSTLIGAADRRARERSMERRDKRAHTPVTGIAITIAGTNIPNSSLVRHHLCTPPPD